MGLVTTKIEAAEAAFPDGEHTTRDVVLAFRDAFIKGWDAAEAAAKTNGRPTYRVVHATASVRDGHVKVGDLVRSKWGGAKAAVWEVIEVGVDPGLPTYGYKHGMHRIRSLTSGRLDVRGGGELSIIEEVRP